ncbi:hypothetical protein F4808DRAFT_32012 [Astrocystis sublimbata]|nr:hypothetical protein F4808DRAFT_32012 [Astrocystis sublimbata]
MSTPQAPIPIVLIGIHAEIGEAVAAGLRPEFDIIRFIQTQSAAHTDLPYLLRGENPPSATTNSAGSADFSHGAPRAVIMGRGFSQAKAEELFAAYKDITPTGKEEEKVVFIASSDATRPAGLEPPPGIEKIMVGVFREQLEGWVRGGMRGGLVLY